jgi:hypothetical protein
MRISLMPYIPDDFICRTVEYAVQGYGKIDSAKAWCQMAAIPGYRAKDLLTQLRSQLL